MIVRSFDDQRVDRVNGDLARVINMLSTLENIHFGITTVRKSENLINLQMNRPPSAMRYKIWLNLGKKGQSLRVIYVKK